MTSPSRFPALLAFLAGGLSAALLLFSVLSPQPDPQHLLTFASTHRGAYALLASLALAWSVFSVPFVVALGDVLGGVNRQLASAARLLTVGGILLLGFAIFMSVGATLSVVSAQPAPSADIAAYQLKFWSHLGFYLTDPGLMAWGLGQLLFGWLAWRGRALPRWTSVVGLVGGAAGLLTLAVYQTPVLALLQLLSFAVWGFAVGAVFVRGPTAVGVMQVTSSERSARG
ncbi:MAG TPA: DUF4386 family protein [Casimicrobiaceae bacterium]